MITVTVFNNYNYFARHGNSPSTEAHSTSVFMGRKMINKLLDFVKEASTIKVFKRSLKKMSISKNYYAVNEYGTKTFGCN